MVVAANRSSRARVLAGLGTVSVLGAFSCTFDRLDELECEEATARLAHCCEGFRVTTSRYCTYSPGGTGCSGSSPPTYTALSTGESRCIQEKSCSQLVSEGVCARAQEKIPYEGYTLPSGDAVCR